MKRKLLWAVKLLCLTLALAVGLWFIQENYFCHADHNRVRVKGFFLEDADSLDVVYLGASEVYSDIAPGSPVISSRPRQIRSSIIKTSSKIS